MTKEFRLIDIEENRDFKDDIKILMVRLAPVKPSEFDASQYSFTPHDGELFIFLDTAENRNFFLENPEEIKELNMDEFNESTVQRTTGETMKTYKHDKYVFAIMDKRKSADK